MDNTIKQKFVALVCRLSPENLHCDGEITPAQAQQRYRAIMAEWRTLEKQIGREVSEEEIERELYAR